MKFAKELERDLVPEWRLKYLDYKQGKKKLKAVRRALKTANQTPRTRRRGTAQFTPSSYEIAPKYSFLNRNHEKPDTSRGPEDLLHFALGNNQGSVKRKGRGFVSANEGALGDETKDEESPLNLTQDAENPRFPGLTRYGSISGTPHSEGNSLDRDKKPPSLQLPGAALDPESHSLSPKSSNPFKLPAEADIPEDADNAFEVGKTRSPPASKSLPRYKSIFTPKRVNSIPDPSVSRSPAHLFQRVFSMSHGPPPSSPGDVPLEAYSELDMRQAEFFHFLDMELDKVEAFYKLKEDEATNRLAVLREQLHVMADGRLADLIQRHTDKLKPKNEKHGDASKCLKGQDDATDDEANGEDRGIVHASWLNSIDAKDGKHGKNIKAMKSLATPSALRPRLPQDHRDYQRRPEHPHIPYRTAKRKLKVALQEYYRGLELLKSYALLNRTAFRKINKKYDKVVNARPALWYMSEKVNSAWFVNSDIVEGHLRTVEDLYARYFEKGSHKVAMSKLKVKVAQAGDYTDNSFRNGLLLGLGAVFGIQGLVKGLQLLETGDPMFVVHTSYLLQLYAGYLLVNLLFILFCLACRIWSFQKINYVFIFEYDTRHFLDWRQLFELPCFFLFLLGFFVWLNFNQFGDPNMYLYYPVILIGLTTIIVFNPFKILYYKSRLWLAYSLWRLVCAGFYPVEWRDFYLGDMFCSLTYSMGNIEVFFCLYVNNWVNPDQCNSSSSRLFGFLTTLPGIWRALQCFRRYYDTGNAFPHLLNLAKYAATILFNMTLSIYRIDKSPTNRALFITFAILNSIYTSFWDVYYDWSLGDPHAKHKFLRRTLGYKRTWWYYSAMVIDPPLRFNWILYTIIPLQLQHSAVTSFGVALSEIFRRAMWSLFRVENEHCSNVGHFRASRDLPLPYEVPSTGTSTGHLSDENLPHLSRRSDEEAPPFAPSNTHDGAAGTGTDFSQRRSSASVRRRASACDPSGAAAMAPSPLTRGLTRMGTIIREAHAQDFEKKKKPELGSRADTNKDDDSDDDSEDGVGESGENSVGDSFGPLLRRGSKGKQADKANRKAESESYVQDSKEIEEARSRLEAGRGEASKSK